MTIVTYEEYAMAALKECDLPVSLANVQSLVVWQCSENDHNTTANKATWNPFDTEEREKGSHSFNSAGVQDFPNMATGLKAYKDTLFNGFYPHIINALRNSDAPAVTCQLISDSPWGSKLETELLHQILADWKFYATLPVGGSEFPDPGDPKKTVQVIQAPVKVTPKSTVPAVNVQATALAKIANELGQLDSDIQKTITEKDAHTALGVIARQLSALSSELEKLA